ncbi:hypothetical protein NECAME_14060 [Necator americanus]|uniref:Uncharacterized protein n=1 Tax=Necator americanus TaxID=51031 RepID=W2SQA7_NECAM|nr:hypothetical protein NECAME_14060 [Necator americanus]ETN71904.1 hypothetical protein NECAME_14060 [Necator americanus]
MGFKKTFFARRLEDKDGMKGAAGIGKRGCFEESSSSKRTVEEPREVPLGADARPSQVLGQAVSDVSTQSRLSLLKAFEPLERGNIASLRLPSSTPSPITTTDFPKLFPDFGGGFQPSGDLFSSDLRHFPISQNGVSTHLEKTIEAVPPSDLKSVGDTVNLPRPIVSKPYSSLEQNPFIRLASTFLRGGLPDFGGIRDFVPGANNNFGIRKGPGCLPFLSEFMQVAYGNCQQVADEKAFDAWGDELKSAILTGQVDLLKASQETCRRGAERQQCGALRRAISNCDILESLQIGAQLQRAMKRCEEVSGLVDQVSFK